METAQKRTIAQQKQRSILLLIGIYITLFFLLILLFPKENDMVYIPLYYLAAVTVLQFSYILYYKFPFKSWPVGLLIVLILLLSLFIAFSVYITGLAAAYQH
ncbi:hypothetical protein SAMN05660841_00445 [Sphingobacterium nematocida]|uniref:Uncharacterized protein n=1 Tax=Sphingobacterium nematocida TaxID=1513896 RepID=A0A1T5B448_9SPHI|nr:hypothetical protein [Sphingobacterium nematocida]SKB41837.1 hypothetical protein SAMN05660841_00445 [Sphingobacterium nematocida]